MNIPLIDGAFIIDNSSLEKLRCPRLYKYSEADLRSPCASRAGANFGSTMHKGWETRYKLCGVESVDNANRVLIESAMHEWLEANPQPDMDFRDYGHACKMMAVYNKIYGKEPWKILTNQAGKPIVEASFALPFAVIDDIPVLYCGKVDLGIRDNNGIWSFDHKTAFQFGETFDKQMSMDGGQLGYCWALGQTMGEKPQGYIIDAVRVRRPSKRDNEFSGSTPVDGTDFKRTPYYVSDDMLAEWKEDVRALIHDIFQHYRRGYFPRHRWQCTNKFGLCEFYDVCSTPIAQREQILQSGMFEENKWSKGLKTKNEES